MTSTPARVRTLATALTALAARPLSPMMAMWKLTPRVTVITVLSHNLLANISVKSAVLAMR